METNILSKWCRLCSTEFRAGVFIFGEEARRSFLHAKIRRYLTLTISMDDKLPKMICEDCCRQLETFHKFATIALRNQEKMSKFVCFNSNYIEQKRTENTPSLLHTYLTKGIKEKEKPQESEVTEMEVRVDPMIILQCGLESGDDDDKNEDEDRNKADDSAEARKKRTHSIINKFKYSCSMCTRSFSSESGLQNHLWYHNTQQQQKRVLNSLYRSQDINYQDISNQTQDNGNQQTDLERQTEQSDSSNTTGEEDEPQEDEETDDDEEDEADNVKFSCPVCSKQISTKGNLKVHLETHRPKGRYGCEICGRIFKTQCNLYRHKEYHSGVQYPCGVCGRVYPTNSTLRAHSITHSDLRPHKCPLCDKTFKRNQDLKFHINQHTGARPYQCPYCPKAFASSGNCFSHRKRMHPMEVERDRDKSAKVIP